MPNQIFRFLIALLLAALIIPKVNAAEFRSVRYQAMLYYSSFDGSQSAVAQSRGQMFVTRDGEFPHFLTNDAFGQPMRVDGDWGEIIRVHRITPVVLQLGISLSSKAALEWLLRSIPKRGDPLDQATAMLDRLADGDSLRIHFRERTKRPYAEFPFVAEFPFYDEMTEERLLLVIELSDQLGR